MNNGLFHKPCSCCGNLTELVADPFQKRGRPPTYCVDCLALSPEERARRARAHAKKKTNIDEFSTVARLARKYPSKILRAAWTVAESLKDAP